MVSINHRQKLGFIKLKDVYYASKVKNEHPGYDAVYYFNCQKPIKNAKEFNTMLIDLAPEPETILRSFRKSTRVEIKKALEDPSINFHNSERPDDQEMEVFYKNYNDFAVNKNILLCHRDLLNSFRSKERLAIYTASAADEILAQFALVIMDDRVVAKYGYNNRFNHKEDLEKVQLISRANRALDYMGMLYARQLGKKYYDLCGLTLDPQNTAAQNVDHYKMGFRGQIVKEYHFLKPITYKGKIFYWLKKIFHKTE